MLTDYPIVRSNRTVGETSYIGNDRNDSPLPEAYDFRTNYPDCKSPRKIFDQGSCGGCWGLSVAATMSDRFCQQDVDVVLSPQELLDCVKGDSRGCNGGFTKGKSEVREKE